MMYKDRDREERKALGIIQELIWIIEKSRMIQPGAYKAALKDIDGIKNQKESGVSLVANRLGSRAFLIGVVPAFLSDLEIFRANEEVAEFSEQILGIEISRFQKRSRYEIIGRIVTSVNSLSELDSETLILAIENILQSKVLKDYVTENRNAGVTWNDLIRRMANE